MDHVAVITDSTCYLSAEERATAGLRMVEVHVVVGGRAYDESEVDPQRLAGALRAYAPVSTSRPSPSRFHAAYEAAAEAGATAVVAVHLSARLSGTVQAAELAARDAPVPVHVVDSRQLGLGLGFVALAAARAAQQGRPAEEVVTAAQRQAGGTHSFFCVDTLEFLRRGGRIGTAQALIGTALSVKPLLAVDEGAIVALEKVRTMSRATARLEELSVAASGEAICDVAVQHLANHARAAALASRMREALTRLGRPPASVRVREVGAGVGAHVGPGMLAVAVSPAL
jgi:DegV family protein with EDD domain